MGLSHEVSRLPPVLSLKTNVLASSASLLRSRSPVRACVWGCACTHACARWPYNPQWRCVNADLDATFASLFFESLAVFARETSVNRIELNESSLRHFRRFYARCLDEIHRSSYSGSRGWRLRPRLWIPQTPTHNTRR